MPRICKLFKLVLFLCNFLRGTFVCRAAALRMPRCTFLLLHSAASGNGGVGNVALLATPAAPLRYLIRTMPFAQYKCDSCCCSCIYSCICICSLYAYVCIGVRVCVHFLRIICAQFVACNKREISFSYFHLMPES